MRAQWFREVAERVVDAGLGCPGVPEIDDGLREAWNAALERAAKEVPDAAETIRSLRVPETNAD